MASGAATSGLAPGSPLSAAAQHPHAGAAASPDPVAVGASGRSTSRSCLPAPRGAAGPPQADGAGRGVRLSTSATKGCPASVGRERTHLNTEPRGLLGCHGAESGASSVHPRPRGWGGDAEAGTAGPRGPRHLPGGQPARARHGD